MIEQFPYSELTRLMQSYLQVGQTVPDDLCVLALERALLDVQCNTRGKDRDPGPCVLLEVTLRCKDCLMELASSEECDLHIH